MPAERGSVLLLAPTPKGWGETAFAVHLGKELLESGWKVEALIHDSTAQLFHGGGIAVTPLPEAMMPFLELMLDEKIKKSRPAAVVLCDIVTSIRALKRAGAGPDALFRSGVPVTGIDTWNSAVSGPSMDMFGTGADALDAEAWLEKLPHRLKPVPFLNWNAGSGVCRFFPQGVPLSSAVRRHIRREFGIGYGEKLVLFCTSAWQYGPYRNRDGERLAAAVPPLISKYLSSLGPSVHLVHIGPTRYDGLALGADRYHWMPPQGADIFEMLMRSADLFLSLNISGVTTIRAVAAGLPVVVLGNSCQARTLDELGEFVGGPLHPIVQESASALLPLYPFTLWPLGLQSFLEPTLKENPFLETLRRIELLDGVQVVETIRELLFSQAAVYKLRRRQADFKKRLMELPTPSTAFEAALSRITGSPLTYETAQCSPDRSL